jgi:urease subunit alpha
MTFLSQSAVADGIADRLGLAKLTPAVSGIRAIRKADMKLNDATPKITVSPENYKVYADGKLLDCEPAQVLPMAQRYFLF